MDSHSVPFVTYLEKIRDSADASRARATLAHLRRGLMREPWTDANVIRYVAPWLPLQGGERGERPYFLVASLFALHPEAGGTGNMGDHFANVRAHRQNDEAVERRFVALLSAHDEDISYHLRQAVAFCKANRIPVNWHRLFADVRSWGHPDRWVQRNWARAFWRTQRADPPDEADAVTELAQAAGDGETN
ncbi:MAG: type I-E CRISPR-associated protein Cse2/CasB [Litorilinea sp.]